MSDLTPEDRMLVDLARDGHEPTAASRRRVRGALVAQLGLATGLVAGSSSAVVAGTSTTASVVVKVLAAMGLVVTLGGGGVVTVRALRAARAPAATTSVASPVNSPAAATHGLAATSPPVPTAEAVASPPADAVTQTPGPEVNPTPALPAGGEGVTSRTSQRTRVPAPLSASGEGLGVRFRNEPNVQAPPRTVPPAPAAPDSAGQRAPSRERGTPGAPAVAPAFTSAIASAQAPSALRPTTLEDETRLLQGGVAALQAGDPARALALFDAHTRAYPHGALAEERAGERVTALCNLGRIAEARSAAASFLQDYPHSPLADRVRASCRSSDGRTNP